ncbi:MAG: hypothetical protein JSR96_06790 [Proteobacteria bacterium]|nr:hypothetical protein [Pseudomonadota bacterium]
MAVTWIAAAFVGLCLFLMARPDWIRLQTMSRRVTARVTGHRSQIHNNVRSYAAIYAFDAEGQRHEVTDQVYGGREYPPVGTQVTLSYPVGRPDLARPPRPLMWLLVYGALLTMLALLIARLMGRLPS